MKKKALKIAAFTIAMILIVGLGVFANALVGNPISKMLATRTAEKHLKENYAGTDFYVESIGFNFKDINYYAHIKSPSSMDTSFSLYISMSGKLKLDTYQDVLDGSNTARRLDNAYRELTDSVLESPSFPFASDIAFGDLEFIPREYAKNDDVPSYALIEEDLELDRLYDIPKLGAKAGHLVIYVEDETVTVERAAEMMLEIKHLMEEGGAPFYAMDFVLEYPRTEPDGPRPEGSIHVLNFLCADIYKEGMTERVSAANDAAIAYFAEMDAKK